MLIALDITTDWADRVVPVRLTLSEAVSECYAATLDLLSDTADLDLSQALRLAATITLTLGDDARRVSGIVLGMSLEGILPQGQAWYRLVLAPRLRLLDLTLRSRVFCTERASRIGDVIQAVLATAEGAELTPGDYEASLSQPGYPLRDMVVQYEESDLAFLSRLAEDAGIFYVFGEGASGERALFGDSNVAFPRLAGGPGGGILAYRPGIGLADPGPAVRSASLRSRLRPSAVTLDERDYASPQTVLQVQSRPQAGGIGSSTWQEANGYVDSGWGRALAEIRAQELAVDRCELAGDSDCIMLSAGSAFTLQGHEAPAMDGPYIAIAVEHTAWEAASGIEHLPGPPRSGRGYQNRFVAIPADCPYRPRRKTPKPSIAGLLRAVIDGTDSGRSELDALGCYRIILPFDTVTRAPGQSSCPVRLASPYGGPAEGLHFPLRPGTQVMVAFHHGDPDRPVIIGPVYDADQKSVVTDTNRYRNVIRTVSGITVTMNDGPPPGR